MPTPTQQDQAMSDLVEELRTEINRPSSGTTDAEVQEARELLNRVIATPSRPQLQEDVAEGTHTINGTRYRLGSAVEPTASQMGYTVSGTAIDSKEEKKEDPYIEAWYSYKGNGIFRNTLEGGVVGLYNKDTRELYLTHGSCIMDVIMDNLKQIKTRVHPYFENLDNVVINIYGYYDEYIPRLAYLQELVDKIETTGLYKLVNRCEDLVLVPYIRREDGLFGLYLRNKIGDMVFVGKFDDLNALNQFKVKWYPDNKIKRTIIKQDSIWLKED